MEQNIGLRIGFLCYTQVQNAIQDALVCIEMFGAALVHKQTFGYTTCVFQLFDYY
jgi:hypothetical protein